MAIARLSLERRYALLRLLELTAALGRFGVELLRHTYAHRVHTRPSRVKSRRLTLLRRQSGATTISGAMSHERRLKATVAERLRLDRRCGFSAYLLQRLLRRELLSVELCALSAQLGLEVLWAKAVNPGSLADGSTALARPGTAILAKSALFRACKERTVSRMRALFRERRAAAAVRARDSAERLSSPDR
jgi:hypothetical protein